MHSVSLGKILYKYFAFLYIVRTTIFGFRVSRNKDGSTLPGFTPLLRRIPTESFDITTRRGLPGYLLAANIPLQLQLRWFSALCLLAEALWQWRGSASVIKPRRMMQGIVAVRDSLWQNLMHHLIYICIKFSCNKKEVRSSNILNVS